MTTTYFMMVNNFEAVDGEPVPLTSFDFKFDNVPVYPGSYAAFNAAKETFPSVQIMNMNNTTLTKAWYVKDTADGDTYSWRNMMGGKFTAANMPKIEVGQCFWFHDPCSTKPYLGFAGQVLTDVRFEKTFTSSYRMLGNPYPVEVAFTDIQFSNLNETAPVWTNLDEMKATATEVWVPKAGSATVTKIWYVKDTADGNTYSWRNMMGGKINATTLAGYKFPAGQAGWFRPSTAAATDGVTVTFNSPLAQ